MIQLNLLHSWYYCHGNTVPQHLVRSSESETQIGSEKTQQNEGESGGWGVTGCYDGTKHLTERTQVDKEVKQVLFHTHTCTHARMHTRTHTHMHTCRHAHAHTHTHTHTRTHTHTHTHTHTDSHTPFHLTTESCCFFCKWSELNMN